MKLHFKTNDGRTVGRFRLSGRPKGDSRDAAIAVLKFVVVFGLLGLMSLIAILLRS